MTETTRKQENRLIVSTLFVFFVSGAASMLMGNLMPFLRETYDISYARAGFLLSLPSWGNLASVFLTGYLPTYIGRRKTVLLTSVWMALAFILVTFGIGGATLLPLACVMIGIARGGNSNFSNTMMSTLTGDRAAVGYNLLHGAFAVGAVLSPLALVACTSRSENGWKIMGGGIIVLCVIQVIVYAKMALPAEKITGSIKSVDKSFLKSKSFWLGSAILFFYISVEYAICNWLVTYFKDSGYLSANVSQMMTSLLWVVMFIGRMGGAYLVGRVPRKALLVADGVGLTAFFLLVFFSRSQTPIFIGIMGVGLFMATIYTTALALGTEKIRGNDLGVSNMVLIGSFGGIITPALVGMVAEEAGIHAGMGVVVCVTVLLLITILCSVFMKGDQE
ncbi:MAG: MFS transporter [Candidatus Faecousia sp.]|nr:MFS transporter [Bacillota bacterium]MDY4754953.1 MFS transporter [Candidatus Faecousia sp.]MDY6160571.1 MFS transporter [Candidatus Faecousia sp.]